MTTAERLKQLQREEQGGLLVIISDLWHSPDLLEGSDAAIARFQPPRWQVVLLHLLHPDEIRPPLRGDVELVDSENDERLSLEATPASLHEYSAAVDRWCDSLRQACARRDVAYARITTDMSLERAAMPYLQFRGILR
jgi:hypothetical protein